MKPERIAQLLPLVGSKKIGQRTGWVLATCPMRWRHGGEKSDAFAVSYDAKKKSRCKCLSCGYSGDLEDLLLDLRYGVNHHPEYAPFVKFTLASELVHAEFEEMELSAADIPEYEAPVEKHEMIFPEQWLQKFPSISYHPKALTYCQKRGIELDTLKVFDVRYDPAQERVAFPFRNFRGELMGMQGRYIGPKKTRDTYEKGDPEAEQAPLRYYQYGYYGHRNMHVWMNEENADLDDTLATCEGPFDLLKIFQAYPNVVASFTSGLSMTKVKRLGDADSLITFYDHGNGGDAARAAIHKYLKGYPIVDLIPTEEQGDAGAMSMQDIRQLLKPHVKVT